MKLIPSLFKHNNQETSSGQQQEQQLWRQWPSCKNPKTVSFRAGDEIFKTVNSVFFDPCVVDGVEVETPESWFTNSSTSASFSTESEDHVDNESLEIIVREARSERLFFEPGGETNSILEEAKSEGFPFKESVVLAMDSENPYDDFRRSMEEMVETHGLKDWDCLEELLGWYLRVNGKKNHGFIVDAFVDLLVSIAAANGNGSSANNQDSTSYSSAISSFSSSSSLSPKLGSLKGEIDDDED